MELPVWVHPRVQSATVGVDRGATLFHQCTHWISSTGEALKHDPFNATSSVETDHASLSVALMLENLIDQKPSLRVIVRLMIPKTDTTVFLAYEAYSDTYTANYEPDISEKSRREANSSVVSAMETFARDHGIEDGNIDIVRGRFFELLDALTVLYLRLR